MASYREGEVARIQRFSRPVLPVSGLLSDFAIRFSNLEGDCFGGGAENAGAVNNFGGQETTQGDYTKNAYMLVYEKRRKQPLKIVVP
jgi:hypothetical protein